MWREPGEGRQDWHLIKYLYRDNPNLSLPSTGWRHRKWFSWQDSQKISHQILNVISGRQEVIVIRRAGGAHEIILIWRNDLLLTSQPALSREDCPQCSVDDWWPDVSWVWPGVTSQDNTPAPHSAREGSKFNLSFLTTITSTSSHLARNFHVKLSLSCHPSPQPFLFWDPFGLRIEVRKTGAF